MYAVHQDFMNHKYIYFLTCLLLNVFVGLSQGNSRSNISATVDGISYSLSAHQIDSIYHQHLFHTYNYIDGKEQKMFFNITKSNPLLNGKLGEGTLFSNGEKYDSLILAYDVYNDQLLNIPSIDELRFYYVRLKKEKIDSFHISFDGEKYSLYQLDFPAGNSQKLEKGFYERHIIDQTHLLFNHTAIVNNLEGYDEYRFDLDVFIYKNNQYNDVASKKKLLKLYPEKKKQIKKKISQMPVPYRQLDKYQILEVVRYVESL